MSNDTKLKPGALRYLIVSCWEEDLCGIHSRFPLISTPLYRPCQPLRLCHLAAATSANTTSNSRANNSHQTLSGQITIRTGYANNNIVITTRLFASIDVLMDVALASREHLDSQHIHLILFNFLDMLKNRSLILTRINIPSSQCIRLRY